jgi:hypothetical protein
MAPLSTSNSKLLIRLLITPKTHQIPHTPKTNKNKSQNNIKSKHLQNSLKYSTTKIIFKEQNIFLFDFPIEETITKIILFPRLPLKNTF